MMRPSVCTVMTSLEAGNYSYVVTVEREQRLTSGVETKKPLLSGRCAEDGDEMQREGRSVKLRKVCWLAVSGARCLGMRGGYSRAVLYSDGNKVAATTEAGVVQG